MPLVTVPSFKGLPTRRVQEKITSTGAKYIDTVECDYDDNDNCICPFDYLSGGDGFCYYDGSGSGLMGGGTGSGGGGGTTTVTSGPVTVDVQVQNAETIGQDALNAVSGAVTDGVTKAVQGLKDIVSGIVSDVASALQSAVSTLWNAIQGAFSAIAGAIGNVVSTIVNNIGSIISTVWDKIVAVIADIKTALVDVINFILPILGQITATIQNINDTLIQPIATFINTTVKTIADLTVAIQRDLHEGLSGIVNIPGQIAGGLSTIDASLNRTVQQLGTVNIGVAKSKVDYESVQLPPAYSTAYKSAFGGAVDGNTIKSTFDAKVNLSSESLQQVSAQAISGLGSLLKEVLSIAWGASKESFDNLHKDWTTVDSIFVPLLDGILGILTTLTSIGALVEPLIEAASEEARSLIPTTKLGVNEIVTARQRGFVTDQTYTAELSKLGYDGTRAQVLKDLSVFLPDPGTSLEWFTRGIIDYLDLKDSLSQHGMTDEQITAFKDANYVIPGTDLIRRWLNFGVMTPDDAASVLRKLHWDDKSVEAYLTTYQARINTATAAQMTGRLDVSGKGWLNNTFLTPTPDFVSQAGKREGLHPDDVRLVWQDHWQLPSYRTVVQAYFRGLRTLTEVHFAMQAENIPQELWDDLIQIERPLIQFRSLGAYVKAGVLSIEKAGEILAAHGFDLASQNVLLNFFEKQVSTAQAAASATTHQLSLTNARELFLQNSLSESQYEQILVEHGYSQDQAKAQVQVDVLNSVQKQQKQELADLTVEVQAGVVTLDDAVSQLHKQGFTQDQITIFQARVQRGMKVNQKHPTIKEMQTWLKNGWITRQDYANELTMQGWGEPWLSAWLKEVEDTTTTSVQGGSPNR